MTASVTIAYTTRETGPARITRTTPEGNVRTVRVRLGRTNEKRASINASLGFRR